MTLAEKILEIMKEVQYLGKDDHVQFDSTDYKALSEEKVTAIMRRKLVEQKIIVYPIEQEYSRAGKISHVDTKYRMQNVEDPDDYIIIASAGDGADSQDKGTGKAMTYAFKYMWLRTFALPTGEDPDKVSSAELDEREKRAAMAAQERPCRKCGKPIKGLVYRGTRYSAADVEEKWGLCPDCFKAAAASNSLIEISGNRLTFGGGDAEQEQG